MALPVRPDTGTPVSGPLVEKDAGIAGRVVNRPAEILGVLELGRRPQVRPAVVETIAVGVIDIVPAGDDPVKRQRRYGTGRISCPGERVKRPVAPAERPRTGRDALSVLRIDQGDTVTVLLGLDQDLGNAVVAVYGLVAHDSSSRPP
jgi:hypothetical protein